MSLIEQLIEMKKVTNENDIVKMLDEFTLYDKLSGIKALGDIESSKALQSKLPHLAKLVEGNFYQLSLAFVARDILNHLEYEIPAAIHNHIANIPERTKKQLTLVGESTAQAEYRELSEYHDERNKGNVVGIYTNSLEEENMVAILIIVNNRGNRYTIYQGRYEEVEGEVVNSTTQSVHDIKDYVKKTRHGKLTIRNYSIQGNNSYPFATYKNNKGTYYISLPDREHLAISKDSPPYWNVNVKKITNEAEMIPLTTEEINRLAMDRSKIDLFTQCIGNIVDRWEDGK